MSDWLLATCSHNLAAVKIASDLDCGLGEIHILKICFGQVLGVRFQGARFEEGWPGFV